MFTIIRHFQIHFLTTWQRNFWFFRFNLFCNCNPLLYLINKLSILEPFETWGKDWDGGGWKIQIWNEWQWRRQNKYFRYLLDLILLSCHSKSIFENEKFFGRKNVLFISSIIKRYSDKWYSKSKDKHINSSYISSNFLFINSFIFVKRQCCTLLSFVT